MEIMMSRHLYCAKTEGYIAVYLQVNHLSYTLKYKTKPPPSTASSTPRLIRTGRPATPAGGLLEKKEENLDNAFSLYP